MGMHYVNGTLLGNLTLDPAQPQALIYEPSNGKLTTRRRRVHPGLG